MLIKRIISASILIVIIIATILNKWMFNVAIILFIVIGLYEFFTMLENKGINIYK